MIIVGSWLVPTRVQPTNQPTNSTTINNNNNNNDENSSKNNSIKDEVPVRDTSCYNKNDDEEEEEEDTRMNIEIRNISTTKDQREGESRCLGVLSQLHVETFRINQSIETIRKDITHSQKRYTLADYRMLVENLTPIFKGMLSVLEEYGSELNGQPVNEPTQTTGTTTTNQKKQRSSKQHIESSSRKKPTNSPILSPVNNPNNINNNSNQNNNNNQFYGQPTLSSSTLSTLTSFKLPPLHTQLHHSSLQPLPFLHSPPKLPPSPRDHHHHSPFDSPRQAILGGSTTYGLANSPTTTNPFELDDTPAKPPDIVKEVPPEPGHLTDGTSTTNSTTATTNMAPDNSTSMSTSMRAKRGRGRPPQSKPNHCARCKRTDTPEWRKGENGIDLCNACGLQFMKRNRKDKETVDLLLSSFQHVQYQQQQQQQQPVDGSLEFQSEQSVDQQTLQQHQHQQYQTSHPQLPQLQTYQHYTQSSPRYHTPPEESIYINNNNNNSNNNNTNRTTTPPPPPVISQLPYIDFNYLRPNNSPPPYTTTIHHPFNTSTNNNNNSNNNKKLNRERERMNLTGGGAKWSTVRPTISDHVLGIIKKLGFDTMTPVQSATIPLFLSNKDVLVEACTGSGKTLSFIIPIIEILLKKQPEELTKHQVLAVIVTPTRELAVQIFGILEQFVHGLDHIKRLLLIGGTEVYEDVQKFNKDGGNVIVATPGRLEDVLSRVERNMKLKEFEMLILDEADRLLDMGFDTALNAVLDRLPKQRRTGLFSATQTTELKELARMGMRNPVKVSVAVQQKGTNQVSAIPSTLENRYTMLEPSEKFGVLADFMDKNMNNSKIIVYFLTCADVDYFSSLMTKMSQFKDRVKDIFSLHGKVPHERRKFVFDKFSAKDSGVIFVTDLVSRGIDFPSVDWVIQYDAPQDPKTFIHRIGRTARMGRTGNAMLYLSKAEDDYLEFMRLRKVSMVETPKPDTLALEHYTKEMRRVILSNRQIMERSIVAFVSYARAYKEHTCSYIFVTRKLDFGSLAHGYGLLRMPKMPELRFFNPDTWASGVSREDIEKVPYVDKKREAKRLIQLKESKKKQEKREKKKEAKVKKILSISGLKMEDLTGKKQVKEEENEDDSDESEDEVEALMRADQDQEVKQEEDEDEEEEEDSEDDSSEEEEETTKTPVRKSAPKIVKDEEQLKQEDRETVNRDYLEMKKNNKRKNRGFHGDLDDFDSIEKEIKLEIKKKKQEEKENKSKSTTTTATTTTTGGITKPLSKNAEKKKNKNKKPEFAPKKTYHKKVQNSSRQKKSSRK
ncbi:putative RNA helicase [Cavenderia fasciculata]|uniref:ATP-dependent RNA helicase n=1 Tax=Cavenderia fasciculata TaxID=261658 RepID=F4PW16_CACFS|nr:putative RNA helicase [Cavenderia fasciculata]EGG20180.1 putative RNA helicase [Cavenderia fasciculata]|eukprot:XP_004367163.1 putative RNA helicase [Cavenderia fasciculata]